MPAIRPWMGLSQLHLLAKLLDVMDDEAMRDEGFTDAERRHAGQQFEDLDAYLTERVGEDWRDREVL